MNNCVFIGRMCGDNELKSTQTGTPFLRFNIAVRKRQKAQNGADADFIECIAWRSKAEFIEKYFHKGDMIALQGSLSTDTYTDKNGNKRKNTYIVVEEVDFCGASKQNNTNLNVSDAPAFKSPSNNDFEEIGGDDSDLPF